MKGKSTFLTDVSAETEHFLIKSGTAMTEEKNGVSPKYDLIFFHTILTCSVFWEYRCETTLVTVTKTHPDNYGGLASLNN